MKAEKVQIDQVFMDPANARTHPQKNMEAIRGSLQRFGQQKPIVIDQKGCVIAGNGTLMAAQQLGWDTIQAVRTTLEGAQAAAFAIADNRTAELAEWDEQALMQTLTALDLEDPTLLDAAGFDKQALEEMINGLLPDEPAEGLTDPDEVPEQCETRCQPGDLWQLGDHRLLCGDSTKPADVKRLMGGDKADLIWTDPPYGVNHIGGDKNPKSKTHRSGGKVHNDDLSSLDLEKMITASIANLQSKGAVLYMCSPGGDNLPTLIRAFFGGGFDFKHSLVWVKSAFVFGRCDYHYKHEMILYGWSGSHQWAGPRDLSTVFEFEKGDRKIAHPTSKPVGLVVGTAKNHPFKIMADPFCGSGTTLIAAEQLKRRCYGIEISPTYCDVILTRWEQFTGRKAVQLDG